MTDTTLTLTDSDCSVFRSASGSSTYTKACSATSQVVLWPRTVFLRYRHIPGMISCSFRRRLWQFKLVKCLTQKHNILVTARLEPTTFVLRDGAYQRHTFIIIHFQISTSFSHQFYWLRLEVVYIHVMMYDYDNEFSSSYVYKLSLEQHLLQYKYPMFENKMIN